jgi:hypothetical protein
MRARLVRELRLAGFTLKDVVGLIVNDRQPTEKSRS